MAIDYAEKYSAQVDERFKIQSRTGGAVNHNYDFVGVQTVRVYDIETVPMNNYTMSGASRYGSPSELGNSTQELTMKKDRSFTFTIDRRNNLDTMGVMVAGEALARQIDEVIVPEIDIYRLSVMGANAGKTASGPVSPENAYEILLDASVHLTDNKCPEDQRTAFVTPYYYKCIKLDDNFIKHTEIAQEMLIRGQVGLIDNIRIVLIPASYMPTDTEVIVTNPIATVAAQKLTEYKIHDNPPGVNGWLIEGRVYYDAFVLKNKKPAIYTYKRVESSGGAG